MQQVRNPIPLFLDARGLLMDAGKIYLGEANADPQSNPIVAYWDEALTIVAAQPLRTLGGRIVNVTNPAPVFIAEDDFSMRITDFDDVLVDYSPSVFSDSSSFQPIDPDLTTISEQANTPYGLALLTLANQTALATATGIPNPLPLTGGTVSGAINRQGAGAYVYWGSSGFTGGRIFITADGAADPTSQPGDIWFTY